MSKITVALSSFTLGMLIMFAAGRFGNQTSTFAQSKPQPTFSVSEGSEPTIPPLRSNVFHGASLNGVKQPLDGFECEQCTFRNVTFTYAGGAVRLVNPKIDGPFTLELKGPAANALGVIQYLQAIGGQRKPAPAPIVPNRPIIRTASASTTFTEDFITPYSGNK